MADEHINKLNGVEVLRQTSDTDHNMDFNWTLLNFSKLPHYISSNIYCLKQECRLLWKVEVGFRRSLKRSDSLDVWAKLHRMDRERLTVRAHLRLLLFDNKNAPLCDGLCSSMFASDCSSTSTGIVLWLKNPEFFMLPDNELTVRLVLKVDECRCNAVNEILKTHVSQEDSNVCTTRLLNDFKLAFENLLFADVILHVGRETLVANKFVLCARSPVFRSILERNTQMSSLSLNFGCKDKIVIYAFLFYLYTGILVDISVDMACSLYLMAEEYKVTSLRITCGQILLTNISTSNSCKILTLAYLHDDRFMQDTAMRFIYNNFIEVEETSDWRRLIANSPSLYSEIMSFASNKSILALKSE